LAAKLAFLARDLILLDMMLPKLDGTFRQRLRFLLVMVFHPSMLTRDINTRQSCRAGMLELMDYGYQTGIIRITCSIRALLRQEVLRHSDGELALTRASLSHPVRVQLLHLTPQRGTLSLLQMVAGHFLSRSVIIETPCISLQIPRRGYCHVHIKSLRQKISRCGRSVVDFNSDGSTCRKHSLKLSASFILCLSAALLAE